ncbi:cupredoxin domain-containing protein [Halorussus gelatinilyticus]|uniref:Cupredoxin domain-containing protein n=1 Tax=Halorussus gelatinilyticus TaxID=2937524 RepID=A0A8U0IFC3_9EURY|nr:cupredoxin domain-containing protein [Halorussus gelatinilyticus]UPV99766.1 cupredoxin domain-containing protein [Halorussus gelatinilyticus]
MMGESSTAESERAASAESEIASETEPTSEDEEGVTRRGFVRRAGGAAAAAGTAGIAASDSAAAQETETYRFGGEVTAWHPRWEGAEDNTNPTIELQAGQEYEFWFENIDGAPHNMTIQDAEGNTIVQSELITEEGATASVTFTATPQMAVYICTIHPTTMVGELNVTGQLEGGEGGGGLLTSLPFGALVVLTAIALALLSPLLFALFLFSRGNRGEGETTTRT